MPYVLQGIPMDLLEKYFVLHANEVRKININTATYAEMVRHPYFDAYLTKTILNYRSKNGDITCDFTIFDSGGENGDYFANRDDHLTNVRTI